MSEELVKQDDLNEIRIRIQNFHKRLNVEPDKKKLKTNEHANNTKYLPISFLQMQMDEFFFGLWSEGELKHQVIGNEIVGTMPISFYHPSAQTWITRTGAAAVLIRQEKGASITDIEKKIKNALVMDFPHLRSACFRNAVLSIGKLFGRDVNRKFTDFYEPIIEDTTGPNELELAQEKIIDGLEVYQGEDIEEIREKCQAKIHHKEFDMKFAKEIAKKIGIEL